MSDKLVTLEQLQASQVRGLGVFADVADASAAAVQEVIDIIKADKSTWTDYTLDSTAWIANTDTDTSSAYPVCYNLTVPDVTDDYSADVLFYAKSQPTVSAAGICPTHYVGNSCITFYAVQNPDADILLKVCLIETATEDTE